MAPLKHLGHLDQDNLDEEAVNGNARKPADEA
jgi:hypothetical protein